MPESWTCACGEETTVSHWLQRGGVMVHDPEAAYRQVVGLDEREPDVSTNEASA
jgi:hypothetical protein